MSDQDNVIPLPIVDNNLITPEIAYERLTSLEADLHQLYLTAPRPEDGLDAMEEYEETVAFVRAAISALANYASDDPPDLDKPF